MHATIQKPIDELVQFLKPDEKVFVVGLAVAFYATLHAAYNAAATEKDERYSKRGGKK